MANITRLFLMKQMMFMRLCFHINHGNIVGTKTKYTIKSVDVSNVRHVKIGLPNTK